MWRAEQSDWIVFQPPRTLRVIAWILIIYPREPIRSTGRRFGWSRKIKVSFPNHGVAKKHN